MLNNPLYTHIDKITLQNKYSLKNTIITNYVVSLTKSENAQAHLPKAFQQNSSHETVIWDLPKIFAEKEHGHMLCDYAMECCKSTSLFHHC